MMRWYLLRCSRTLRTKPVLAAARYLPTVYRSRWAIPSCVTKEGKQQHVFVISFSRVTRILLFGCVPSDLPASQVPEQLSSDNPATDP